VVENAGIAEAHISDLLEQALYNGNGLSGLWNLIRLILQAW
jgi:hypothetical protein